MGDGIRVYVIKKKGRKSLYLLAKDPNSTRTQEKSAKTTVRREAERAAAAWEIELSSGQFKPRQVLTWEDFKERYRAEGASGLADTTQVKVDSVFNSIDNSSAPPTKLTSLTEDRISRWQAELRQNGLEEASIKSYSAHLQAALNWAFDMKLLAVVPTIRMPQRARSSKAMRGRPPTDEEFWCMMACTWSVVGKRRAGSWAHYLHGLRLSGLRLTESAYLEWDGPGFSLDYSHGEAMLRIPADQEKGFQDRLLPITPDFAEFLNETPKRDRKGFVFNPQKRSGEGRFLTPRLAGVTISAIGKKAGVVVDQRTKGKGRNKQTILKYASAHDLRRAFGTQWAKVVLPQELQLLMRHESIETTMKYYVVTDAMDIAAKLRKSNIYR